MVGKILHIAPLDKFIPGFIDILNEYFDDGTHTIITTGDRNKYSYNFKNKNKHFNRLLNIKAIVNVIRAIMGHEKIIIHGLFSPIIIILFGLMPWVHKKIYWIIWGGDLYCHKLAIRNFKFYFLEIFRKILIKRIYGLVTYIQGDVDRAREWYGATGNLYECIMYKSNIYSGCNLVFNDTERKGVTILMGNSADPTNNHEEIFQILLKTESEHIINKIYCPLSYGDLVYANKVKYRGEQLFGDKFVALLEFMPISDYNNILDCVDIAVFAHERQQAMGNTINLLGRGKTVFLKSNTSSYAFFKSKGVYVQNIANFNLSKQSIEISSSNNEIIRAYFSEDHLVEQLNDLFYENKEVLLEH